MMPCLMYPFEERKKPVEVSIQVFLKLKQLDNTRNIGLHKLCSIYQETEGNLSYFLTLFKIANRLGIRINDLDRFVDMVNIRNL